MSAILKQNEYSLDSQFLFKHSSFSLFSHYCFSIRIHLSCPFCFSLLKFYFSSKSRRVCSTLCLLGKLVRCAKQFLLSGIYLTYSSLAFVHASNIGTRYGLVLLQQIQIHDKIQRICNIIGPDLVSRLQLLSTEVTQLPCAFSFNKLFYSCRQN